MRVFASSKKDIFLVMTALLHTALLLELFRTFESGTTIHTTVLSAAAIFLTCMNFQCVAHNFIHTPFFKSRALNLLFSCWNTLLIGVPQTIYKFHHFNHHRYNNDEKDEAGKTQDYSSLFRYSKEAKKPESLITYSLLGPFRTDLMELYRQGKANNQGSQIILETLFFLLVLGFVTYLSPSFVVFCYLPTWYLGQVAAYAENYFEHFGATPGNRMTDSVSCYSPWYNFIWFNNGYHQEHHYRPQIHWSKISEVQIPKSAQRRIVKHAHWFNWPKFKALGENHDSKSVFR